jgi:SAM-dependent methyltransferase
MALNPFLLGKLLPSLVPGQAIASMGYPDVLYPPEKLERVLGTRILNLKYREDSEVICKRHGVPIHRVPDAESLFEQFGVSLDVYDIVRERGSEIVLDLNHPYPEMSREQYDYVLDVGTLEHCFNVAQAGMNMAGLLKVGGIILHENPFNWGNHGFYGLNPTWYHDFYTDNGFELMEIVLLPRGCEPVSLPKTKRFIFTETEANLLAVAKRTEVKPFVFPTQTKYRKSQ